MNKSKIKGWVKVVRKAPLEAGHLEIYHRPGEDQWVDLALAYWQGKLNGLTVVKSSRSAIVHKGSLNQDSSTFYAKRFLIRDLSDWIKHMIQPSRAKRALIHGEEIQTLGFSSPRALCLIEERRAGFVRQSALITEAIYEAPNIWDWLNRPELEVANSIQRKRQLLRAFGRAVGAWHEAGLYHGDIRTGNILCRASKGGFLFFWLDNERSRKFARLPMPLRVHNLMQVNMERRGVTLTDRMRFWKAYLEETHIPPNQQKRIMWKVIRKTKKRWKKRGWM
jgi:tRNA A-37 threonylcarbamoyl transferase component Bud32